MKKKVMLGMSGGVDSSVAAILLLEKGYDVTGVTLKLRPDECDQNSNTRTCCSIDDISDARRVAYKLGIDHIVMNFTEIFKRRVINNFVEEYTNGRTPNPCIACNKYIKFDAMLHRAKELGFDYIATGHYANIEYSNLYSRYLLKKSKSSKDQSYVLYNLTQEQLSRIIFPLGNLEKDEIRQIANKYGIHTAMKADSQEICFVPDNKYANFIKNYTNKEPASGNFVDINGNILGKHKGITNYTIGQRRGLGIALGKHMYVISINPDNNTIVLGDENQKYTKSLVLGDLNFISIEKLNSPIKLAVKTRYKEKPTQALIEPQSDNKVKVRFLDNHSLVAKGQSAVFYDNDIVVGGGIVT